VKILGKSDGECPREVRGVHLGCGGMYFKYRWQWEYYFFIRQQVKMAGKRRWWAILFWGWYGRYIHRLIFDSYTNYDWLVPLEGCSFYIILWYCCSCCAVIVATSVTGSCFSVFVTTGWLIVMLVLLLVAVTVFVATTG